jgi:hypothetical protein
MPAPIFRAPMRARDHDAPGADHGLAHGLVGIGPGSGAKAERMLRRFVDLPDGTPVWTRDGAGGYHLGRIDGPWRLDDSAAARAVGLHDIRPATWIAIADADVPAAVIATFARGGRNLQRIHDEAAEHQTAALLDAS